MDSVLVMVVISLTGPLLGAGVGTYIGLRISLNGLRGQTTRIEDVLGEVRDFSRDTCKMTAEHVKDTREAVQQLAPAIQLLERIHSRVCGGG